jgi:hypothetical protein
MTAKGRSLPIRARDHRLQLSHTQGDIPADGIIGLVLATNGHELPVVSHDLNGSFRPANLIALRISGVGDGTDKILPNSLPPLRWVRC